jgi:hypothetical protein
MRLLVIAVAAVRGWRFESAAAASKPEVSDILVIGVLTPPRLTGPTLGVSPKDVRPLGDDVGERLRRIRFHELGLPVSVTVNVFPAMVAVPVRGSEPRLGAMV